MTEPSIRPLPPEGRTPTSAPRRTVRIAAPLIAAIAAGLVLAWPNPEEADQVEPIPIEPVSSIAAPPPTTPPAVESFESFIAALNKGDAASSIQLLAPELPDVVGLGTFSYPLTANDPELWTGGELEATSVASFVEQFSGLPGPVFLSNCSAFGDGPQVTVVACSYAADRLIARRGFKPELGKVFGFMVDSGVAGVAYRAGRDDSAPIP